MKKLLSIILAILMIVTTVPVAFAAEDTPDFSDANELTSVDNFLYINGEWFNDVILPEGKYKLSGNISTSYLSFWTHGEVLIDLNGYIWNMNGGNIIADESLSVYDTSTDKTGKITTNVDESGAIVLSKVFNLYGGTIENTSSNKTAYALLSGERTININLYGGKVISNGYAVYFRNDDDDNDIILMLGDVVLESGDGYAQIYHRLSNKKVISFIDVTDYTGESLEVYSSIAFTGKVKILEGVKSAKEAEKYKINAEQKVGNTNIFAEKIEYDEATGCINAFIALDSFIQQPSADNNLTVDFNNPAATFQWYEVDEKNIGVYTVNNELKSLFTYDFKAGDILLVSTDSDIKNVTLGDANHYVTLSDSIKTKTIKFDNDETVTISSRLIKAENPVEIKFSVITKETVLDGETGKTLQNPECDKSYWCKVTVYKITYTSDTVAPTHTITQIDAKAPTCTEIGWDAYESCTECDYTTYEVLPADPDAHTPLEAVTENEVAPKCDVAGSYDLVVYCDDCGTELDRDTKTVDALKHSFTKYEVTEEAKCGVEGKEVATCDNGCGATDEKAIDALRHSFTKYEVTEEAKCGVAGKEVATCDNGCGATDEKAIEALTHKDADGDYKCDNGCGHEFEKPVTPDEPTPDTPDEPTDNACDHLCHKTGILGFFWKIVKFFSKLFKLNPVCECGAAHY